MLVTRRGQSVKWTVPGVSRGFHYVQPTVTQKTTPVAGKYPKPRQEPFLQLPANIDWGRGRKTVGEVEIQQKADSREKQKIRPQ